MVPVSPSKPCCRGPCSRGRVGRQTPLSSRALLSGTCSQPLSPTRADTGCLGTELNAAKSGTLRASDQARARSLCQAKCSFSVLSSPASDPETLATGRSPLRKRKRRTGQAAAAS